MKKNFNLPGFTAEVHLDNVSNVGCLNSVFMQSGITSVILQEMRLSIGKIGPISRLRCRHDYDRMQSICEWVADREDGGVK
jgi:hypothetical protein